MSRDIFNLRTVGIYTLFIAAAAVVCFYIAFQARFLIAGPSITLLQELPVAQAGEVVMIEGIAKNIVAITLNDRPIFINEDGRFVEPLILENGYSIMTLRARDRYGREEVLKRPFVYSPAFVTN